MTISVKQSPSHRLVDELLSNVNYYQLYFMFFESRLKDRYIMYLSNPVKFSHCKYPFNPPVEPKNPKINLTKLIKAY